MRRALILCSLVATLASDVAQASIHGESTYRDMIRPHGQPRSNAVYNAAVNGCYAQAHESRTAIYDTPAYKACMLKKGWRFVSTNVVRDPAPVYASRQSDDDAAAIERENDDAAARDAAWQQQQQQASDDEAAAQDAANAGYAQAAAQAAQDQSNAASFAAQMTVGNQ